MGHAYTVRPRCTVFICQCLAVFFYLGECKGSKDLGFLPLTMQVKVPMQNCPTFLWKETKTNPCVCFCWVYQMFPKNLKCRMVFPLNFQKKTGHLASIHRTAQPFWWASARFLRAQLGPRKHRNIWGAQFQPRKHLHEISLVSNQFFFIWRHLPLKHDPFFHVETI